MSLFSIPKAGQSQSLAIADGAADAYYLAQYSQRQRLVIFTQYAQDAQRLVDEIAYFQPQKRIALLPDWETLVYDQFSPHADLISERLSCLWQLYQEKTDVLIVPIQTAMARLPPPSYLMGYTFFLRTGEQFDLQTWKTNLARAGYRAVTQVYSPGEFSVRGSLVDIFPTGSAHPYRIDLLDNVVDSISTFDVEDQRSLERVLDIRLLPAREFPSDQAGCSRFRQQFRETFEGDLSKCTLYKAISTGVLPAGIEYYLPLFFEKTATIFDYFPKSALLVLHHAVGSAADEAWSEVHNRYRHLSGDAERPILKPEVLFVPPDAFFKMLNIYPVLRISKEKSAWSAPLPGLHVDRQAENPIAALEQFIAHFKGKTVICAESLGRRETMAQFFKEYHLNSQLLESWQTVLDHPGPVFLVTAPLSYGFILSAPEVAVVTEADLYGHRPTYHRARRRSVQTDHLFRDLSELKIGDRVVHEAHGIGLYQGLISLDLDEGKTELLLLEYADGDQLYVPVSQLHVISRYAATAESVALHKLGSNTWEKCRRRAAERVRDTAAELLNLYAQRATRQGHAFTWAQHDYDAFAAGFGFEETPDQTAAIDAVLSDMRAPKMMDRLVCGDVGFGKTEVALRAAFAAVSDGQQVAILVPTTLLAEQHFQTFQDRFANWPVTIAQLSRFRNRSEIAATLHGLATGSVDIVIGTHKLVQGTIQFAHLGLVIIDEEHRFGVRQKEQLKALRVGIDVLTLTATPIPRTLAMSLEGLRDFSFITTAPSKRLSVKTFVSPFSEGIIREAVLRELKRGGQIFFLHNEVDSIEAMHQRLVRLLPEAQIGVAHGQMHERELEYVMRSFYQQRFNLLLCTTILETGIDIPNANTILMNRADRLGLAQLHQMRGRVGRSHHQAYAYLLIPDWKTLTVAAQKRLEAIQAMEELGAGFQLAMHDLEIRGAGEVLGDAQSGEINTIGFALYTKMLNEAVAALKMGKEPDVARPLGISAEVNLHVPTLLPEDYCPDVNTRLSLYKRLALCERDDELDDVMQELIDRFGLLPESASILLACHRLRVLATALGIYKIDASVDAIVLCFSKDTPVAAEAVVALVQSKNDYQWMGQDRLRLKGQWPEPTLRAECVKALLQELTVYMCGDIDRVGRRRCV